MSKKLYLYPVWIRIWHLVNAIFFLILILSGLCMQYSNPQYPVIRFDIAVAMHNYSGIFLTLSYLVFFLGNIFTNNGRYYKIRLNGLFSRLSKQFYFYTIGIFKGKKPPFPVNEKRKFNPMQKVSYVVVMYIALPLVFITGWGLLFPEILVHKVFGVSGLLLTDIFHVILGFILSIFMIVHIYLSTLGKVSGSRLRSIIDGYHDTV